MAITSGIFSSDVNFEERLIGSLQSLAELAEHLRGIGLRLVLTSGSFDLVHLVDVECVGRRAVDHCSGGDVEPGAVTLAHDRCPRE